MRSKSALTHGLGVRYPWAFGVLTLFEIGGMPSPPQAVNLRAGVVVAMGATMLGQEPGFSDWMIVFGRRV